MFPEITVPPDSLEMPKHGVRMPGPLAETNKDVLMQGQCDLVLKIKQIDKAGWERANTLHL